MPEIKERETSPISHDGQVEGREGLQMPEEEHSPEVESVVEKLEQNKTNTVGDKSDDMGNVVTVKQDQPAVTVPVAQDDITTGSKMPITSSFRWLVEWVKRQIKKFHGRVIYSKPESDDAES